MCPWSPLPGGLATLSSVTSSAQSAHTNGTARPEQPTSPNAGSVLRAQEPVSRRNPGAGLISRPFSRGLDDTARQPVMRSDRADKRHHRRGETPARQRNQRDFAGHFGLGHRLCAHPGDRRRKFGQEADAEAGGNHHLDPVLAFALKPDADAEAARSQLVREVVAILAIDPPQIGFAGDIPDFDMIFLLEMMPGGERNAEALAVKRQCIEPLTERVRLRHYSEIELALQQHFRQPDGHSLDESDLATRVGGVETCEKAHEACRPDRTHDAKPNLRFL